MYPDGKLPFRFCKLYVLGQGEEKCGISFGSTSDAPEILLMIQMPKKGFDDTETSLIFLACNVCRFD